MVGSKKETPAAVGPVGVGAVVRGSQGWSTPGAPAVEGEITLLDRIRGCLLGGAVGDALGARVEFMKLPEIRRCFGAAGIRDFAPAYGRLGAITDDTQMTLFTAEGFIRAWVRDQLKGMCHGPGVVHHAYMRWLLTQGEQPDDRTISIGVDGLAIRGQGAS
jgi:hypothetical protein